MLSQPQTLIVLLSFLIITTLIPWSEFYKDFEQLEPLLMWKIIVAIDAFDDFSSVL